MATKIIFLYLFILCVNGLLHAQHRNKADSVRLQHVIEGKEEFKINDETKKAIEEGRLIVPSRMKNPGNKLNEIELMQGIGKEDMPDSLRIKQVDPFSLPPGVFALYILYMDKFDSPYMSTACKLTEAEREMLRQLTPGGHDFNHILSMVFSPLYRRRAYNAKHATAYKSFNAGPSIKMTEYERSQLRKTVNGIKKNPVSVSVKKSGPIDNF